MTFPFPGSVDHAAAREQWSTTCATERADTHDGGMTWSRMIRNEMRDARGPGDLRAPGAGWARLKKRREGWT